jgi:uracil-DNA glycosylase
MSKKISEPLPSDWMSHCGELFKSQEMLALKSFLANEKKNKQAVYPLSNDIFQAFWLTSFENVKVVILGQDPYHGVGQAHGLAFSVAPEVKVPPSLKNIFKEIERSCGPLNNKSGFLIDWAKEGVFLLNQVLTVREGLPASHQGKGWEFFTDGVIKSLSLHKKDLVFLLWGSHAQKKLSLIDQSKHLVLKAPHPSPLSAHRGFLGCDHFVLTNKWLQEKKGESITWRR